MKTLVSGGAGFIGSAVVRLLVERDVGEVTTLDALTYAGRLASLRDVDGSRRHRFIQGDLRDPEAVESAVSAADPDLILHLAAETHVDRSIDDPRAFVETNVVGTFNLLEAARRHWRALGPERRDRFRFVHVSTDEVFGSLGPQGAFVETTPYDPRSPYSASKAASDHLARAWFHTYGLPVMVSNCSNNYGPFQFPEKLIPLSILNALKGRQIGVYGQGANVRDWLHVEDHAEALLLIAERGEPGRTYNVGARNERSNLEVVQALCAALDTAHPEGAPYARLIRFVTDRPGHDARYAIDPSRLEIELGWRPRHRFEQGLADTVDWYLNNAWWWRSIRDEVYAGERIGRG